MATEVQRRRGTTTEHATFTGADGELTVDTTKKTVVVHDGTTVGGVPLAREDLSNVDVAPSAITPGTARQLLQTDAAGTGVEWTSNVDVPGTLDVTSTATFDSIASHPLGSAGAPTITFTGDTNTGIYSPGADQLALSTNSSGRIHIGSTGTVNIVGAGTAGTTQAVSFNGSAPVNSVVLDSSGRLGIGTSSPSEILDAYGSIRFGSPNVGRIYSGDSNSRGSIQISAPSENVNRSVSYGNNYYINSSAVWTASSTLIGGAAIEIRANNNTYGEFLFRQKQDGDLGGAERIPLVIANSGNVGIGTTSPATLLHLRTTGTPIFRIQDDDGTGQYSDFYNSAGQTYYNSVNGAGVKGAHVFLQAGTESARIDSSGNVGIGESSPSTLLHLKSATGTASPTPTEIRLATSSAGADWSTTDPWGRLSFYSADTSGGGPKVHSSIDAVADSAGGSSSSLAFKVSPPSGSSLNEALRITSAGLVGIGTTSPGAPLDIAATIPYLRLTDTDAVNTFSTIEGNNGALLYQSDKGNAQANSGHIFYVDTQERFRCDSSGRLLVGTSTSYNAPSITGTQYASLNQIHSAAVGIGSQLIAEWSTSTATGGSSLKLAKSNSGTVGSHTALTNNMDIGSLVFAASDGTSFINAASILSEVDGTPGTDDMPGRLVFSTTADGASSPTERMRIAQDGAISTAGILTAPSATVFGTFLGRTGSAGLFETSRNVGAGVTTATIRGNAGVLNVHGDGDCENTNNSYGAISDIKLKENIVDAGSQWDDLKALQVRKYNFKAETGYNTHTQIGLIAQEVELVSPGLVGETIDEETGESTKSVNYSVLYMKAVKALQEAMERIETLEAKVAVLETP